MLYDKRIVFVHILYILLLLRSVLHFVVPAPGKDPMYRDVIVSVVPRFMCEIYFGVTINGILTSDLGGRENKFNSDIINYTSISRNKVYLIFIATIFLFYFKFNFYLNF